MLETAARESLPAETSLDAGVYILSSGQAGCELIVAPRRSALVRHAGAGLDGEDAGGATTVAASSVTASALLSAGADCSP